MENLAVHFTSIGNIPVTDKPVRIVTIETGTVLFKGRRLPASIARVEIPYINRRQGEVGAFCFYLAGARDDQFGVWRYDADWICEWAEKPISKDSFSPDMWRRDNQFIPN